MTPTEELRKVYAEAVRNEQPSENSMSGWHAAGLLAVARYSAQRQRDMEPTEKMKEYGRDAAGMHVIGQWDTDEEQEETLEFIVEALNSREELDRLRAEREGRVLVPREPSEKMVASVGTVLQPYTAKLVWQRMLAAAEEESSRG